MYAVESVILMQAHLYNAFIETERNDDISNESHSLQSSFYDSMGEFDLDNNNRYTAVFLANFDEQSLFL